MPSKNKTSISFAVSEDKVGRNKFAFSPRTVLGDFDTTKKLSSLNERGR